MGNSVGKTRSGVGEKVSKEEERDIVLRGRRRKEKGGGWDSGGSWKGA